MAKPDEGTRDWFIEARLDILEGMRALQALKFAAEAAIALAQRWDELSATLRLALITSAIVNYSRPFVDRHTDRGVRRYKLKRISGAPEFDVSLHKHLLQLRHKMVAHSDEDFLDARLHAQTAFISRDDHQVKLIAELGARSTALWQMQSRATAEAWRLHMSAAALAAARDASGLLQAYFKAARDFPDACPLLDLDGKEEKLAHFTHTGGAGETFSVPLPEMPLTNLKTPPLAEEPGAHLYQLLELKTQGAGTTVTDIGDGFSISTETTPVAE